MNIENPSDKVVRNNYWNGRIALLYPSDYGYASNDLDCRNNLALNNCKNNNWLFDNTWQWALTPSLKQQNFIFDIYSDGNLGTHYAYYGINVRPVLFLKSDIVIAGGTGVKSNPYILK